ncbi:hypothetical protein BGZ70_004935, partial [Mortierella alpina]
MESNYFTEDRRVLWMKSYRQDVYYGAMDTNNYVESWHNQLKTNHLKNHYRARPDRILYILTTSVLEAFKKEEFGAIFQVGRKTKGQILDILRRKDVEAMSDELIENHVRFIEGRCTVLSPTDSRRFHDIVGRKYDPRLRLRVLSPSSPSVILGAAATATLMRTVTEETKEDKKSEI